MIQLTTAAAIKKAVDRAKESNLLVQPSGLFRMYYVTNRTNGQRYTVNFVVRTGRRFGGCTCPAGERGIPCKHLAAAAALHVCLAEQRQQNRY